MLSQEDCFMAKIFGIYSYTPLQKPGVYIILMENIFDKL